MKITWHLPARVKLIFVRGWRKSNLGWTLAKSFRLNGVSFELKTETLKVPSVLRKGALFSFAICNLFPK